METTSTYNVVRCWRLIPGDVLFLCLLSPHFEWGKNTSPLCLCSPQLRLRMSHTHEKHTCECPVSHKCQVLCIVVVRGSGGLPVTLPGKTDITWVFKRPLWFPVMAFVSYNQKDQNGSCTFTSRPSSLDSPSKYRKTPAERYIFAV